MGPLGPHSCYHQTMNNDHLKSDLVFNATLGGSDLTFHSTWGLFSPKAIDEGTGLLMGQIQTNPDSRILDLGCGYGPLGIALAKMTPHGHVTMIDKDFVAINFARKNIDINTVSNAEAYLSNG